MKNTNFFETVYYRNNRSNLFSTAPNGVQYINDAAQPIEEKQNLVRSGCIKSLFTAEKRKEGAKLRRAILLYFNALRSSVIFLSGSLRLNFLLLIQPFKSFSYT